MSVVYKNNCEWRMIFRRARFGAKEMPQWVETWIGRQDKLTQVLADNAVGTRRADDGYIISIDGEDRVPKSSLDLVVAYAPDFNDVQITPGRSIKTATKSATVTGSNLIPESMLPAGSSQPSSVVAKLQVSYYAPEVRYRYFSPNQPDGPKYETITTERPIKVLNSTTTVNVGGSELAFPGSTASAAIVAALTMPLVAVVVSDGGAPIKGTPWYECEDVVTLEYKGD